MSGEVMVGYVYGQSTYTPQFGHSMELVLARDFATTRRIVGRLSRETSGVHVPDGRCKIVADFLAHPAKPEWLWMVDADATFADDIVDELLAAAHPTERPIVGALAFGVKPYTVNGAPVLSPTQGSILEGMPTLYAWEADGKLSRFDHYPRHQLVQVHGTGAHCMLIHRRVLADERWQDGHPLPWYRTSVMNGETVSEDQFFCVKAGALGYPIHVHTGIKTGHVKTFVADEDWYLRTMRVPPADERIAVIVPILGRPDNAAPFMRSLVASTGLADVFVCGTEDDARPWVERAARRVASRSHTFPVKVNDGYRVAADHDWFLFVGDDVTFRPGWWDHALFTARTSGCGFIATNDLCNPYVMVGRHATHPIMSRRYIEQHGASWDGPGTVAHEAYRHWFVDNEWTARAHQLGEFAYSPASIIEHLHPVYGKGVDDAVYAKARTNRDRDQALIEKRVKQWA